jgi:hypothetical protein
MFSPGSVAIKAFEGGGVLEARAFLVVPDLEGWA